MGGRFTPYTIADSVWMADGSFLVGAGQQLYLFGDSSKSEGRDEERLFERVARMNGPLEDYNPQMLLQCLLWGKGELVKEIIVNLAADIKRHEDEGQIDQWTTVPVNRYLRKDAGSRSQVCTSYVNRAPCLPHVWPSGFQKAVYKFVW